ncbi:DUF2971 domain-containing protein [Yersinia enterocolitica]|nr:DUF2971 domain-containing protein [Yersinia enterocolitica]ELX2242737.1 DUF2971 domain-containing protein [Yersinia enterocolitica]HDL6715345.1 DUF2971 domain-containing protein [Yersinia enterocolitica]HDL6718422.1 DUF2971 domain-containing protein [Yersinia enterocolitica]HDL6872590.1 DUF2971 domain-containing protein [Yersinia enterocolitica]
MSVIYHYCNPEAFLQIIEKKKLWLSTTNNMNDSAEDRWVENALGNALRSMIDKTNEEWCNQVWSSFTVSHMPKYVACFSTDDDSLSQWRAYAQDGEGVAIGFDESLLGLGDPLYMHSETSIKLSKIGYLDTHELEREISLLLNKYYLMPGNPEASQLILTDKLNELGLQIKNPAFEEEKETRFIYWPASSFSYDVPKLDPPEQVSELKYRIASGYLTSYYEFDFSARDTIVDVVLGPKNKFTEYDIYKFLGINNVYAKPRRSAATYR